MSADIRSNSPKKEFLYALGGVALFLTIVLIVGISAFLRPAGQHITVENTEVSTAADQTEVVATAEDATTDASAELATQETEGASDDAVATQAPAENTAVVAPVATDGAANDTVDQAAVANADLTAEQADGDLEAGDVEKETTAQ